MELDELKAAVIRERAKAQELGLQQDAAVAAMNATPEKAEVSRVIDAIRAQAAILGQAEDELRILALSIYRDTGNTKPTNGVMVKLFTTTFWMPDVATEWCRTNLPEALKLDSKVFEKAAVNIPGAPIKVTKEPRVQIATDLK